MIQCFIRNSFKDEDEFLSKSIEIDGISLSYKLYLDKQEVFYRIQCNRIPVDTQFIGPIAPCYCRQTGYKCIVSGTIGPILKSMQVNAFTSWVSPDKLSDSVA